MEQQRKELLSDRSWMLLLVLTGFFVRLLIGTAYYNTFDLSTYNIPWAIGVKDGLFSAYQTLDNLDYPPLFPTLLWFVGGGVSYAVNESLGWLQMFFVKLWPIVFDALIILVLYRLGRRHSQGMAILLATVWALNLSAIMNCAIWGQTDSLLLLWIALMMIAFQDKNPTLGTVWFAVGCLTKLQMVYFAPLLLLELFFHYRKSAAFRSLGIGLAVGIVGWLPFMIGSGNPLLPFDIYLGGYDSYNYLNLNAFNAYGIVGANWVNSDLSIFGGSFDAESGLMLGGFTFSHLSTLLTLGLFVVMVWGYWQAKKKNIMVPMAVYALFWMNGIFILTVKMHERYQMPVLILVLLCFAFLYKKAYFRGFLAMTAITFLNQALLLFKYYWGDLVVNAFNIGQPIFSVCNVLLFVWLIYLYRQEHEKVISKAV